MRALLRPFARVSGVDAGECAVPFRVTYPSAVDDFKKRIDPFWDATDASIQACVNFTAADKAAWQKELAEWRAFRDAPTALFGSGGAWDQTCAYARSLDAWREGLEAASCKLSGPATPKGVDAAQSLEHIATILKWGTIGIGGAVLFATFYPELKALLGVGRKLYAR